MNGPEGLLCVMFFLLLVAAALYRRPWRPSADAHGTARLAEADDLRRAGMLKDGGGLTLGVTADTGETIYLNKYVHLSIFSPAGGGKSRSFAIPWLKAWRRGSAAVLDLKGELYLASHRERERMGQRVVRIDPFGVCGPSDGFNPLDWVPQRDHSCVDAARAMAEAMVSRTGEEKDPHWNDQAANLLTAYLALILATFNEPERNLASLRTLATTPESYDKVAHALIEMGMPFRGLGGTMLSVVDKERAGVVSTLNRHLNFLDSLPVLEATLRSSVGPAEMVAGNCAAYFVLPPHQLEAQSRLARLFFSSLTRLVGHGGMAPGRELLMLLDEAGQLGHMPALDQGLTLLRSYGLRMCFMFQSTGQLAQTFKGREAVLMDSTEHVFMGVNSVQTAQHVSQAMGTYTLMVESQSESGGEGWQQGGVDPMSRGVSVNRGSSLSRQVIARELMKPAEVLRLPADAVVGFFKGVPPLVCRRLAVAAKNPRRRTRWRLAPPGWFSRLPLREKVGAALFTFFCLMAALKYLFSNP